MILREGKGHIVLNSSSYIHLREILLAEQWHTPASSHNPDQLDSFLIPKYFDMSHSQMLGKFEYGLPAKF